MPRRTIPSKRPNAENLSRKAREVSQYIVKKSPTPARPPYPYYQHFIFFSFPYLPFPFVFIPFVSIPFVSIPFVSIPFVSIRFVSIRLVSSRFLSFLFFFSFPPLSPQTDLGPSKTHPRQFSSHDLVMPLETTRRRKRPATSTTSLQSKINDFGSYGGYSR